jgi:hypothetical protein
MSIDDKCRLVKRRVDLVARRFRHSIFILSIEVNQPTIGVTRFLVRVNPGDFWGIFV